MPITPMPITPMPITKSSGVLPPAFTYTSERPWHQRHRTLLLGLLVVSLGSLVTGSIARLALWREHELGTPSPPQPRFSSRKGTTRLGSEKPHEGKLPSLGQLRARALRLERRGDHRGAYIAYSKILERDSGDQAMKGFVRNGVELGHEHLLFLLPPDADLAQLLGVRLWMVKGNWSRAAEAYVRLPWRLRRTIRLRLWHAEILQRSGHLERSRHAYARLLDDPRLQRERKMRIEAMIGLSEVLLDREYEFASRSIARRARRLLGVDEMGGLRMRIERQLDRCEAALAAMKGRTKP
jgi:hypothetical protein